MIKNILFGVDGSPGGDVAGTAAMDLALRLDARLEAIHVVDSRMMEMPIMAPQTGCITWNPGTVNGLQEALKTRGENLLKQAAERGIEAGIPIVTTLEFGHPAQVFVDVQSRTELVIIGRQGENSKTAPDLTGSTMERFIRRANRPCLVTTDTYSPIRKILVGADGSPSSARALRESIELANALHVPLVILTVAERKGDLPLAEKASLEAHTLARAHDCAAAAITAVGAPAIQILEQASEMDCNLIILGSHGHGWIYDRLIGSSAAHVVSSGDSPVLLVH